MPSKRWTLSALALPLLASALCGALRAAELGKVKVNSHIGQQLSADIELVDLTPADLADLQARLANPDVFKGANVAMRPELGGLFISIAKRDNKRFLHLTTLQPVNAEALHLFLELNSGGRQIIRAASLWLMPEPPAAKVAAAPAAVPAPLAASPVPPASGEDGLSEAAQRAFAHRKQVAMAQAQEAAKSATAAAVPSNAPAPMPVPVPATAPAPALIVAARPEANSTVAPVAKPVVVAPRRANPPPQAAAAAPAPPQSCAPAKQVEAQLQQCEAMTSKLAAIEGKVQRLQTALVAPAAVARMPASAVPPGTAPKADAADPGKPAVAAPKPDPAPVKPGATPVKPAVAADLAANSRTRLAMIIGGVLAGLAALGGAIFFLRKRQDRGPLKIWQSFRKKGSVVIEEPVPELTEQVAAQ